MTADALDVVRRYVAAAGLEHTDHPGHPGRVVVGLPGEHRLSTPCVVVAGAHTVTVTAFVCRAPEENHTAVYRWLLQRNARLAGVAFSIDGSGDVYLVGRVPSRLLDEDAVDALFGAVAAAADDSFDRLVGLGFEGAVRREWAWRLSRGESTANLRAFGHLRPTDADAASIGSEHDDDAGAAPPR